MLTNKQQATKKLQRCKDRSQLVFAKVFSPRRLPAGVYCVVVDIQPWRHCCVETGLGHGAAPIDLSTGRQTLDRARPACEASSEAISGMFWAMRDSMGLTN